MATQRYWSANYWTTGYWSDDYWATQVASGDYWGTGYWGTGYWAADYWADDVTGQPSVTDGEIIETLIGMTSGFTGTSRAPGNRSAVIAETLVRWTGAWAGTVKQVEVFSGELTLAPAWDVYTIDTFTGEIAETLADATGVIEGTFVPESAFQGEIAETLASWTGAFVGEFTPLPTYNVTIAQTLAGATGAVAGVVFAIPVKSARISETLARWTSGFAGTNDPPDSYPVISTTLEDWTAEFRAQEFDSSVVVGQLAETLAPWGSIFVVQLSRVTIESAVMTQHRHQSELEQLPHLSRITI